MYKNETFNRGDIVKHWENNTPCAKTAGYSNRKLDNPIYIITAQSAVPASMKLDLFSYYDNWSTFEYDKGYLLVRTPEYVV